jgi:hypothetical protein
MTEQPTWFVWARYGRDRDGPMGPWCREAGPFATRGEAERALRDRLDGDRQSRRAPATQAVVNTLAEVDDCCAEWWTHPQPLRPQWQ